MISKQDAAKELGVDVEQLNALLVRTYNLDPTETGLDDEIFMELIDKQHTARQIEKRAENVLAAAPGTQIEEANKLYAEMATEEMQISLQAFATRGDIFGRILGAVSNAATDAAIARANEEALYRRVEGIQTEINYLGETDINNLLGNMGNIALPSGKSPDLSKLLADAKAIGNSLNRAHLN